MVGDACELPPRVLARIDGAAPGPLLICIGALHGNEREGLRALEALVADLAANPVELSGSLLALVGNRRASARGVRHLSSDLNRGWPLAEGYDPSDPTEAERAELWSHLERGLEEGLASGAGAVLLDLHSTSGPSAPFAIAPHSGARGVIGELVEDLGIPLVEGLSTRIGGALMSYWDTLGQPALVVEGGQADTISARQVHHAALWRALVRVLGVDPNDPRPRAASALLAEVARDLPPRVRVEHVHAIEPGDGFRMARPGGQPLRGFQVVEAGTALARDAHGLVRAPFDGYLLMPLYQGEGREGYFLAR